MIQTIRAADLDNFANGKFSFNVPAEIPANPNFIVRDNGGKTLKAQYLPCSLSCPYNCCTYTKNQYTEAEETLTYSRTDEVWIKKCMSCYVATYKSTVHSHGVYTTDMILKHLM